MKPVRIGIAGLGGYAGAHHEAVVELERRGEARLICTCDPRPDAFLAVRDKWSFPQRGVKVFDDYTKMLNACHRDLDLVVVPTPIPLHAEMHRVAVERGLAVYLEKPPTLDYQELELMIAREATAKRASLVGFNFIIEETRQSMKRRLLAGEFGKLLETRFSAQWPRPASYFQRNDWAGRLFSSDGHLILDSCFGNAIAHFVHNMLFWVGTSELMSWGQIATVQAELYRAHAIEGADTFFVETNATNGVGLRFALTHASGGSSHQTEFLVCERATIKYVIGKSVEIRWNDDRLERVTQQPFDALVRNHLEYYRYLRGEVARPATTLSDSRPFVVLNDLAYVSSQQIRRIPAELITKIRNQQEQTDYVEVAGMESAQDAFLQQGTWPSERGWSEGVARKRVTPNDLVQLNDIVRKMSVAAKG